MYFRIYLEKDTRFGEDRTIYYKKVVKKTFKHYKVGDKVFLNMSVIVDPENFTKEKSSVVATVKKINGKIIVVDDIEDADCILVKSKFAVSKNARNLSKEFEKELVPITDFE